MYFQNAYILVDVLRILFILVNVLSKRLFGQYNFKKLSF